jgi:hypothetical protein
LLFALFVEVSRDSTECGTLSPVDDEVFMLLYLY